MQMTIADLVKIAVVGISLLLIGAAAVAGVRAVGESLNQVTISDAHGVTL
jgi:hypothetical protein